MLSPEQAAQVIDAARRHRRDQLHSLSWHSSPGVPTTPDLSRATPVVDESEEDYTQNYVLVCMLLSLILFCGVLILRFFFMTGPKELNTTTTPFAVETKTTTTAPTPHHTNYKHYNYHYN
ncbi:hypothetical protein MTO96_002163 [Rhipicephalus appendiculatus]